MECYNCGKALSDPLSVKLGIGPDCRRKTGLTKRPNIPELFPNRAQFSWGIDGQFLWLKDNGQNCRSLTNDMECSLVEIQAILKDVPITQFTIVYKDSIDDWDGVTITKFQHEQVIRVDAEWVKVKGGQYMPQFLEIDFFYIGAKTFTEAKEKVLSKHRN